MSMKLASRRVFLPDKASGEAGDLELAYGIYQLVPKIATLRIS
jgi:hypothetical protein